MTHSGARPILTRLQELADCWEKEIFSSQRLLVPPENEVREFLRLTEALGKARRYRPRSGRFWELLTALQAEYRARPIIEPLEKIVALLMKIPPEPFLNLELRMRESGKPMTDQFRQMLEDLSEGKLPDADWPDLFAQLREYAPKNFLLMLRAEHQRFKGENRIQNDPAFNMAIEPVKALLGYALAREIAFENVLWWQRWQHFRSVAHILSGLHVSWNSELERIFPFLTPVYVKPKSDSPRAQAERQMWHRRRKANRAKRAKIPKLAHFRGAS